MGRFSLCNGSCFPSFQPELLKQTPREETEEDRCSAIESEHSTLQYNYQTQRETNGGEVKKCVKWVLMPPVLL